MARTYVAEVRLDTPTGKADLFVAPTRRRAWLILAIQRRAEERARWRVPSPSTLKLLVRALTGRTGSFVAVAPRFEGYDPRDVGQFRYTVI
jgi:hypothetical protein